jgi:Ca2+-binding RTX toxin-like protein
VNLTNSPTREESYPAPSPDGSLIAYKGQIGAGNEILVIKADGTQPVAVTHDPIAVEEFDPTWEHIYTCGGRRATIVGSDSGERLRGTKRADVIVANGGRDKIKGKGGKDRICAGSGKDRLIGGEGKDRCVGGPGRDKGKACEKGKL